MIGWLILKGDRFLKIHLPVECSFMRGFDWSSQVAALGKYNPFVKKNPTAFADGM
jgi:hypothetical protein